MADLEKSLEQAIEEALPQIQRRKGDSKTPVKQGSSDVKIESGKGEVVKRKRKCMTKQLFQLKVQRKEHKRS